MAGPNAFTSPGNYFKAPIVADCVAGADKIFLMIKEGATVIWERLPVHLYTTLTRVKHFALYSDAPTSIGGHQVVDILYETSQLERAREAPEFALYRKQLEVRNLREMVEYEDIKLQPDGYGHNDGWHLDRFKNLPMLEHAYKVAPPQVEWFVFMDGDTYIFFDNLAKALSQLNSTEYHYLGNTAGLFAHGGSGVVLSRGVMDATFGVNDTIVESFLDSTFSNCCGDWVVADMLRELVGVEHRQVNGIQGQPPWDVEMKESLWCEPFITTHHLSMRETEVMWEYERYKRLQGRDITYAELYNDHYLPYLMAERKHWDNRANYNTISESQDQETGITPSDKGGPERRPYENVEACRNYCQLQEDCLSFRLRKEPRECQTAPFFRFGRATRSWLKSTEEENNAGMVSGWMVNRIREMRARSHCDQVTEFIDGHDRVEGWYYRLTKSI
jgi:hypothetical protein